MEEHVKSEDELRSKPLSKEDAYFRKIEEERLRALAERTAAEHKMICPRDGSELVHENRAGIVVDRCPQCKGAWLDEHEVELLKHVMTEDEGVFKKLLKNLLPYQGK